MRLILGLIGAVLLPAVAANAAPAELLNKSIHISFTTTIPARAPDGRLSKTTDRAPGENSYRFDGNRLVGVQTYASGAAQMVVTFGTGGQSCNVSFISGREQGKAFRFKGVSGVTYEAPGPASWSNVSCSISPGNAFAN